MPSAPSAPPLSAKLRAITESTWFQSFITAVILFAAVLVGIETYPETAHRYHGVLAVLDQVVLWIFVAEIALKMGAEGSKPWRYFLDPWNVFDFVIVAACFLPFEGNAITVLRLLRLLRVLRLVKALPKLQVLVGALLKSIPSMFYVTLLLLLLFYVYAVAAVFLFSGNDPIHFETLQLAMLSLFRVVTLEDWTDVMYINMYGCDRYGYGDAMERCTDPHAAPLLAALFFVSFVLLGTMIVLNLFIGVIMNGMTEAQAEADRERDKALEEAGYLPSVDDEFDAIEKQLDELQKNMAALQRRMADQARRRRAATHDAPPAERPADP